MQTIQLPSLASEERENVTKLWLAPGAVRVAAVYGEEIRYNSAAVCWDAAERRSLWDINLEDSETEYPAPEFDRDLTRVVYESLGNWAWGMSGSLRVRAIATGRERVLGGHHAYLPALAPDGRFALGVVTPQRGARELRRWSFPAAVEEGEGELAPDRGWLIRQPEPRGTVRQMDVMLMTIGVSPDGKRFAGGRYNGTLTVWDVKSRKELMTATAAKQSKYTRYQTHRPTFSPDGSLLATLCERRKADKLGFDVGVWAIDRGTKLKGPKEKESVNGIAFSPDGQTLLTARDDGTVGVWDVATWKLRREYAWKIGTLCSVTFAPDGLICAAGGEKGRVVVWDAE